MPDLEEVLDWRRDDALDAVPNCGGIFVVEFPEGLPYLGRTAALRKRLRRLLRPAGSASTRLTLREIATRVHFGRTGSVFESDVALYRAVQRYRPGQSREYLKLRPAFYVKLLLGNRFPRSCVTQRLTRGKSLFYGPFPDRTAAESFQGGFLDLFLVRRCTENLAPSPFHPGCVWGEMGRCMRPCQAACDDDAYAREVRRMALFLETDGESLLSESELSRDNASKGLDFEAAARFHKLMGKTKQVLRLRAALCAELGSLHGVVLQRSATPACLQLTAVYRGSLQAPVRLHYDEGVPTSAPLNAQIRAALSNFDWIEANTDERQDHLSLLQRWHGSSFRKGEFVPFADISALPWRRLANAALRVAAGRDRAPIDGGASQGPAS